MNHKDRRIIEQAIANKEQVTVVYNKPKVGPVMRHVRPYEASVNRTGKPVVWGTDSIHGPRQIHAFRADRILAVKESQRPKEFKPAKSITKHLDSYKK
jgi:predicted DNA-binding transcriptional regulator YafY